MMELSFRSEFEDITVRTVGHFRDADGGCQDDQAISCLFSDLLRHMRPSRLLGLLVDIIIDLDSAGEFAEYMDGTDSHALLDSISNFHEKFEPLRDQVQRLAEQSRLLREQDRTARRSE